MATTGTTAFTLDIVDIAEEAFERAGLELRTGYDLRTARKSLNIMMLEWQNMGVNLWTTEEASFTTVQSQATYTIGADTIDVLEQVVRVNDGVEATQSDTMLDRISMTRYTAITNKVDEGKPTQMWFDRQLTPQMTLWPVPDSNTYKIYYWRVRRIEDVGTDGSNNMDIPERFIPAMVAGLAFYIAQKHPERADRVIPLKEAYDQQFALATAEDREKVSTRLVPMRYDRGL